MQGNPARDPRLWTLAVGNFAVGTGSMVMAGLVPVMARDLGVSIATAGQTITAFAIAVALGGPLLAGPTSRLDRRTLLAIGLGLYALGTLAGALAVSYEMLMATRVLAGLGACLFTPHASAMAASLAPAEQRGRAISLVFVGFTLSSVMGVPIGILIGDAFGWRATLGTVGVAAVAALVALWRIAPKGVFVPPIGLAGWGGMFKNPVLMSIVVVNLVQILAQMMVFSYIAPLMITKAGIDTGTVGLVLMAFGCAGVVGNWIAGRILDRIGPTRTAHLAMGAMGVALVSWLVLPGSIGTVLFVMGVWGLGAFSVNTAQQTRLIGAAPQLASASLPLNSSAIYVGQALGAAAGGALLEIAGVGILPAVGLAVMALAAAISFATTRGLRR